MSRLLFITGHPPWPPMSGGRRREYELISRLAGVHEIEVCAVDKDEHERVGGDLPGGPVPGVAFGVGAGSTGTSLERAHASDGARSWIRDRLRANDIDLVHCEGYFLHHLLPPDLTPPVVVGTQNVEYELLEQRLALEGLGPSSNTYRTMCSERARELAVLSAADRVVCVTDRDATTLGRVGLSTAVVPDGCDHLVVAGADRAEPTDVLFVGNFGYEPNRDAAAVLCGEIMPLVRQRRPGTRLRLLGNGAVERLARHAAPDVELLGPVESVASHLAAASVVVAPLRVGGGVKVKVLEALHAGAAIVGSSLAAHGLEDHGGALIVEDDWDRFAEAVVDLLDCESRLKVQREAAVLYAAGLPGWEESARRLSALWAEVCPSVVSCGVR